MMDHSQAKRYAISMVAKHIYRDLNDIVRPNFLVELEHADREKIEGCLKDLYESIKVAGLTKDDFENLGFITKWLRSEND